MALFAKRWTVLVSFLLFFLCLSSWALASQETRLELSVKVSPDSGRETRQEITNSSIIKAIEHTQNRSNVFEIPVSDTYLTYISYGQSTTYVVDYQGNLFDEQKLLRIELKESLRAELIQQAAALRTAHYGTFMEWGQAKQFIPKKAKFKVIDMETGLSFLVQRRAGSSHADVQPLTKEDTAIMKKIYGGKWSWARRSIIVETDQQKLAASMHGMPHGGDGIPGNNFSGHFCIHFAGSTTHGSKKTDPDHQLMVYKAAGKLGEYLNGAAPDELVSIFFLALNMQERQIVKMTFIHSLHPQLSFFLQYRESVRWVHRSTRSKDFVSEWANSLAVDIPVEVRLLRKQHKEERMRLTFQLKRASLTEPWKIASIGMVS